MRIKQKRWAEGAVIYQIYPRSFQDSNGDGIGDLRGVIQRLDYLESLGVNGVWMSPFYPSPMADFGYDVSDYQGVDPMFGTMDDFKELLANMHARDMKLIIDIVPSHTSDEHDWFKASRQSRTNKYSDWYVWKDPSSVKNDVPQPPNNWLGMFDGQSAWEWVPERQQFYLHSFDTRQPDLNWENPEVQEAMLDMLRYWLDLGVDGFRVDAVQFMAKDPRFTDNPPNPDYVKGRDKLYSSVLHRNSYLWPAHYGYLREMAKVLTEKPYTKRPRFMVTEGFPDAHNPVGDYMRYFESLDPAVAAPFIFQAIWMPWEAHTWHDFLSRLHAEISQFSPLALSSYAFGNHDQPRLASRLGPERARAAAVIKLTLPGLIFVFYGEDIGMHNVHIAKELSQDPQAIDDKTGQGRDPMRTPMQWSAETNAGFSTAPTTWLPLADDYTEVNVAAQEHDPHSSLNLYRRLIALRQSTPALKEGDITFLDAPADMLVYQRTSGRQTLTTIVNFAKHPQTYPLPRSGKLLISSNPERQVGHRIKHELHLDSYEAVILGN